MKKEQQIDPCPQKFVCVRTSYLTLHDHNHSHVLFYRSRGQFVEVQFINSFKGPLNISSISSITQPNCIQYFIHHISPYIPVYNIIDKLVRAKMTSIISSYQIFDLNTHFS